jgi:cell division protein ZapA
MGQVSVILNGRSYRLECGEGEESHLSALAEYVGSHVEELKRKFGQIGDDRLIVMAALLVTDELWELRRQMEELKSSLTAAHRDRSVADESQRSARADLAKQINAVADRLDLLNERFNSEVQAPAKAGKRP